MTVQHYRQLKVWQFAMDLAERCYLTTKGFPKEELFGLTSQIRRSAASIPANIAEGQGRDHTKEFLNHLSIARGSLMELETHLMLSHRVGLLQQADLETLLALTDRLSRMLSGLRRASKTTPGNLTTAHPATRHSPPTTRHYQLTHDYLVHSLRDWLTRKQKETRRGRAELLLADRAAVWNARPENRQLPSLLQWFNIQWCTQKKDWTLPQRKMIRTATRYHLLRGLALVLLLATATVTGLAIRAQVVEQQKAAHAAGLVQRVLDAETAQVPGVVDEMTEYRKWTDPLLRQENGKAAMNSRQKLHASLALLPMDATQVEYLCGRLLDAGPREVPVIRDALAPHKGSLLDKLWAALEKSEKGRESQRLRAASALAKYDPDNQRWGKVGALVVNDLVLENPIFLGEWSEAFRPVRNQLLSRLSVIFRDRQPQRTTERSLATNLLAEYLSDQSQVLADLLMDADDKQFSVIYPKFAELGERGLSFLADEVDKELLPVTTNWTVRFHKWEKDGQTSGPCRLGSGSQIASSRRIACVPFEYSRRDRTCTVPNTKGSKRLFRSGRHDGGDTRRRRLRPLSEF